MTSVSPLLRKTALRGILVSAVALLSLSGCGTGIKTAVPSLICPAIGLVKDTSSMTRFRAGTTYQPADVLFQAQITDLSTGCDRQDDKIVSTISFSVAASKGAAFGGGSVSIPYFVAVTSKTGQILAKQVYSAELSFDSQGRASLPQRIEQRLDLETLSPRPPSGDDNGGRRRRGPNGVPQQEARTQNFEILIGLQLSDDDLVYNISQ